MERLTRIDSNLWEVNAPLKLPGLRMDHRMTVIRLSGGGLLVHSPIQFSQDLLDAIAELGEPKWFIAPSLFHDMFWPEWFRACPKSRFVAPAGMRRTHPELPFTDTFSENSNHWPGELECIRIKGMPKIDEHVMHHRATRTIIVADLIFNLDTEAQNVIGRLFLKLNGIYRKPGISRMFRAYVKDRAAFVDSVQQILTHEIDRIVPGHGRNLDGRIVLRQVAQDAGIPEAGRNRIAIGSA